MKIKFKIMMLAFTLIVMQMAVNASAKTPVTDVRISKPYHYLHITGTLDVKLEQSAEFGITVKASQYQVYNTITWCRNDTLFVYQTNLNKSEARTKVFIRVDNLALLEAKGDVTVDCSGLINADMLTLKASDGARIKLDVRALKVESKATGCSHIDISGTSASAVEDVDGCGTIDSHLLDVMDKKANDNLLCVDC
jgi:hypothetical protein